MPYKPPYTITSKILSQVSNIVELLSELKYRTKLHNTPKLRKKNRIKSITGTLQIEGNSFTEEKVTGIVNGSRVLGTLRENRNIFAQLPIESVVRDNQERYYKALEESGIMGESTPFIEFMLGVILESLQNVLKYVPDNVPKSRIESILEKIKREPTITIKALAQLLDVNEKTIKRDIEKLKEQGSIVRVGANRGGYWEIMKISIY